MQYVGAGARPDARSILWAVLGHYSEHREKLYIFEAPHCIVARLKRRYPPPHFESDAHRAALAARRRPVK